jgi:uncharacterized membrane protein
MNLLLPPGQELFWLCMCISALLLLAAIVWAPWQQLLTGRTRQHMFFASILFLAALWLLQARVQGTLAFHPLLITVVTMVFGWNFSLVIGASALVMLEVYQVAVRTVTLDWDMAWALFDLRTFPVDFCVSVLVPASWTWCMLWLVNRWKFKNPFTYFWGVGFFGAMIGCVVMGAAALLLFAVTGSYIHLDAAQEHFFVFLLMAFPEGFSNGIVATGLTVLAPELVKTYRDDWFLKN